jgi:methylase of polypeptide subunit release factors
LDPGLFRAARAADVLARMPGLGADAWRSLLRAATLHDMIFLHSAFPTNAPDAVFFGPDTYRFAAAITHHLRANRKIIARAIDIGCGSGAGGILIAREFPAAEIILSDINQAALAIAQVNALSARVTNAHCRQADVFDGIDGAFDLIVANPPYLVDPLARAYRHGGGPLGAGLSTRIVKESLPRLSPGGSLLLYTGSAIVEGEDRFLASIAPLLNDPGYTWDYREADPDVFGEEMSSGPYRHADRIAAVVLTVQRKP